MTKTVTPVLFAATLSVVATPLTAHHGRAGRYDVTQQVTLKGTVTQVSWRNPHIAIFIDVKDDNGSVVEWVIEHSNISTLVRQGYGRTTLRAGESVTAIVNPGVGGATVGLCNKIVLSDGREIFQRNAGVD
jgi:DNA/RNA endonuclease YhcR with UshA esterase domain